MRKVRHRIVPPASVCRRGARCPAIPEHPVMPPVSACTRGEARRATPAPPVPRPAGKLPKPPAGAAWEIAIPIAIAATPAEDGDRHVGLRWRDRGRARDGPRFIWLAW